jgi:glucosylceramidase
MIDGDRYRVSRRLWAMAAFSRFIRPGATRVAASTAEEALRVSAYENSDSSKVVELLNLGDEALQVDIAADRWPAPARVSSYLTDSGHAVAKTNAAYASGVISVEVAPRALLTVVATPASS